MTPKQLNCYYQDVMVNLDNELAEGSALTKKNGWQIRGGYKRLYRRDSNKINAYLREWTACQRFIEKIKKNK